MVIPEASEGHGWFQPEPGHLVDYLMKKRRDPAFTIPYIKDVNIYKYQPSELPGLFSNHPDDRIWYFFCPLEKKNGKSDKVNRRATGGSWKKTGNDHQVAARGSNQIGIKKIFVFYKEPCSVKENKTNWVMHEYSEIQGDHNSNRQDQVVLCRIERKPDKKRMSSSFLDKGQASDNVAYDSGNNVAQDNSEVQPYLQASQNIPYVTENISPEVKSDQLQPNQHPSSVTTNVFPENKSQPLPNPEDIFSGLKPLVLGKWDAIDGQLPEPDNMFSELQPVLGEWDAIYWQLPEPDDMLSGLEPPVLGEWDAIDGQQLPISSVFGEDHSIIPTALLGSERDDTFMEMEWKG